jgi:hypothetical protein
MERQVAQDMVNCLAPLLHDWRSWDISQLLAQTEGLRGKKPVEYLAERLHAGSVPQMVLHNMRTKVGKSPEPSFIIGGISDELRAELLKMSQFAGLEHKLKSAQTYERNRITVFAAHMPVAAAGLTDLEGVFKHAYETWRSNIKRVDDRRVRERSLGLFHCFPDSVNWPDPTECTPWGADLATIAFAKALAISAILKVNQDDLKEMDKQSKSPKEKLYALFRVGQSAFWLWPFFVPYASVDVKEKPFNLGTNISDAFKKFKESKELQEAAEAWVQWYREHWSDLFTSGEALKELEAAQKCLPTNTGDESSQRLWRKVQKVLEDWAAEF